MEAGGGGGGWGESECIQYGELENTKWEEKVQGNAGKVKDRLGGNVLFTFTLF